MDLVIVIWKNYRITLNGLNNMEQIIKDYIISKENNKILGFIEVHKDPKIPFLYSGKIIQNNFPKELVLILDDYVNAVNDLIFSILDELEEDISKYNLYLDNRNVKIFLPHIDEENQEISFYIKYPSFNGFLDNYPLNLWFSINNNWGGTGYTYKIFQQDVNWDLIDSKGRTSLDIALGGLAPIGADGKSINLHLCERY